MNRATKQLTIDDVRQLPPVVDVPTASAALGLGRSAAYELIRTGQWPTPALGLGKLIRIPTGPLLELLGIKAMTGDADQARTRMKPAK
jgi:predicted DNA-binding transcriptional regulator AlpA